MLLLLTALFLLLFSHLDDCEEFKDNDAVLELSDESEESSFSGMALAGCPSAKDVARIASQKSIDKSHQSNTSETSEEEEEEEESSEEESSDEEEDPKAAEEKRLQRELKLLQSKIKSFK